MTRRIGVRGGLVSVVAVAILTVSACSSGDGGSSEGPSSSATSPTVSVAAGVEKDSVLDLNSTKDMTGVVTTVPIGESPYDKNMPDICGFITPTAMGQLKVRAKKKGFSGTPLVAQTCYMTPAPSFTEDFSVTAGIYVNNIQEHLSVPHLKKQRPDLVNLFEDVRAYVLLDSNFDGISNLCEIAWGTFYGTAVLRLSDDKSANNICGRAIEAAKVVAPLMPRSPSQMRPTS